MDILHLQTGDTRVILNSLTEIITHSFNANFVGKVVV